MTLVLLIISFLFTVCGISGFVVFLILENFPSAILAVATGVINLMTSHIQFLKYKNQLHDWYTPKHLHQIGYFGCYCFAMSTSALVYFAVIEIFQKKAILPVNDSAIIPIIWASASLISGLILLYFGSTYGNEDNSAAIEEQRTVQEPTNDQTELIDP